MSSPPVAENKTFVVLPDTPRLSEEIIFIAGIKVRLYGLKEALAAASGNEIGALHVANPRQNDYRYCKRYAFEVIHQYNKLGGRFPLFAVTFDAKNHGERIVNADSNEGWASGNELHGQDMVSIVKATADECITVIKYLPAYLGSRVEHLKIHNIMSGSSQGGHITWRVAGEIPSELYAAVPVIASPHLAPLLRARLAESSNAELEQRRWPRALNDLVVAEDGKSDRIPSSLPIFALTGADDKLVPASFTRAYRADVNEIKYFEQEGLGHKTSQLMTYKAAEFLSSLSQLREHL